MRLPSTGSVRRPEYFTLVPAFRESTLNHDPGRHWSAWSTQELRVCDGAADDKARTS